MDSSTSKVGAAEPIALAATGVPGLDHILRGGLPRGELHLVQGAAGTGKTTLALQFLLTGVAEGERGLYITLSQTEAGLQAIAASHGWSLAGIAVREFFSDDLFDSAEPQTVLRTAGESAGEGQGSTFTVELPTSSEASDEVVTAEDHRSSERELEDVRVLLVEDDPGTREAMACTLALSGADVVAVDSALAALEALASGRPPDVLLSDLGLPGMDGSELLRRVRANERARSLPETPAALVTAYTRVEPGRPEDLGRYARVAKPVAPEQLVSVVRELAGKRRRA